MFLTCPLPTQYLLLFVPSHTQKGKKNHRLFPLLIIVPVASIYSRVHLLSTTSMHTFLVRLFDGHHQFRQSNRHKFTKVVTTPTCLYWFWFGFEVKWVKGQGRVCKFVMACHDKNIIHDSMIWEREKKKTSENKVICWYDKVTWFSSIGYLHRQAHREAYQPVKVFSLGLAAAGRKFGDLGLNEPIITIPLLFSQTYIFPFCCILVFLIQSHKS